MSYGLEVFDETGAKTLSIQDRLTRIHTQFSVLAGSGSWVSVPVPGITQDGTWGAILHTGESGEGSVRIVNGAVQVLSPSVTRTYTVLVLRF